MSFALSVADGVVAAVIAGCSAEGTDFPEPPGQLGPTVCGQGFLTVTGSRGKGERSGKISCNYDPFRPASR